MTTTESVVPENKISWQQLQANIEHIIQSSNDDTVYDISSPMDLQPRLMSALQQFCLQHQGSRFMLINAEDCQDHLSLVCEAVQTLASEILPITGYRYEIVNNQAVCLPATSSSDNFAATAYCLYAEWIESEQLFGCLRQLNQHLSLSPGLIHQVNGGVLVLSMRTLLSQPRLWQRLKQYVSRQRFVWQSAEENRPLPIALPDMPLDLKVIIIADYYGMAEFQEFEPEVTASAIYAEFEPELEIDSYASFSAWLTHLNYYTAQLTLPNIDPQAAQELLVQATRYTGDQWCLPLSPLWIKPLLTTTNYYRQADQQLTALAFQQANTEKKWRESYLQQCSLDEVLQEQIIIDVHGKQVGVINGLSVLEYPGHPTPFGEVSRISCVVYMGDNEVTDVDRKAEMAGNLHAKGMMIMQAFIAAELATEHQLPFSASLVFEQSYSEIDGDSASLAELCVLMSALAQQPISQSIAVTGSVDQNGNIQPVGGINEKIEAFFDVCDSRELTGEQGVIIPFANQRHLSLKPELIDAVKQNRFHLWTAQHVTEIPPLLMNIAYRTDDDYSLISMIQNRIDAVLEENKSSLSLLSRLTSWYHRRLSSLLWLHESTKLSCLSA